MFDQFVEKNHSVQNGIFVEILPDGGALINKVTIVDIHKKLIGPELGPFYP